MAVVVLNENFEKTAETLELPADWKEINPHNLYLFVKAFHASMRANTAKSKTRTEVSGGGKKPWSQKGRGGARAGSRRSPVFVGGGTAFGPTKRNYVQKVNKKQQALATKLALSTLSEAGKLFVVEKVAVESGKTKDANSKFQNLESKSALVVAEAFGEKEILAFRNLPKCEYVESDELNGFTASKYQAVVIEKAVWENLTKEG
jgi:large subunit ribosomal protein L4